MYRQSMFLFAGLSAAFSAVIWSGPVCADTIVFSNLGPGGAYLNQGTELRSLEGSSQVVAAEFSPTGNFRLTGLEVALANSGSTDQPNSFTLSLEGQNSSGLPDGLPFAIFTLNNLPTKVTTIQPSQTLMTTAPVRLLSGENLWLVANAASGGVGRWNENSVGKFGGWAVDTGNGFVLQTSTDPGSNTPAFAVLGTPLTGAMGVPEPATLGLMVLGLLGAGWSGRKRSI